MKHQIKDFIYISAVLVTLLFSVVALDTFTGALVLNLNSSEENISEGIIETIISNVEGLIENTTVITNSSIENVSVENVTNSSDSMSPQEIAETNTSTQNLTLENVTKEITGNIVQEPEVLTQTTILEERVVQYQAVIGQPVKWKKIVKLDQESSNVEIELPKDVEITSIQKIEDNQKIDITSEVIEPSVLTGLLALTGFAVLEEPDATSLIIKQNITEVEIEYETEAPQVFEEELSSISKIITVSSNTHYENILTFTEIPDVKQSSIMLYWLTNGTKTNHQITEYKDNNNNGLIDEIYWITPHLSNESFQVDITVLNIKSFPSLYGNWTVNFTTNGTANLTITPINGTSYGTDLEFLELSCGSTKLNPIFNNISVFYQDYNCNDVGSHVAKVTTAADHVLKFEFGNDVAYAYNAVTNITACGVISSSGDYALNVSISNNGAECLNISASNVQLDCAGFTIGYNQTGIQINTHTGATSLQNISIFNCVIDGNLIGIRAMNTSQLNITNNTIRTHAQAGSDSQAVGILLTINSNYSIITKNDITTGGGGQANHHGIQLLSCLNINVTNNNISTSDNSSVSPSQNFGIDINAGTNNSIVIFNNISTNGSDFNNDGVTLEIRTTGNNVSKNIIRTHGRALSNGVVFLNRAFGNTVEYNNISTNGSGNDHGIMIENAIDNNVTGNNISTAADQSRGIDVNSGSARNILLENDIATGTISTNVGSMDGIRVRNATSTNITRNRISTRGSSANNGILLDSDGNDTIAIGNNISTIGGTSHGINVNDGYRNSFYNNTVNASNVSSNDWRSTINSFGNFVTNLTLGRTSTVITFQDYNGTVIKAIKANEPRASINNTGATSIDKYINITATSLGSVIFINISYNSSDIASINESKLTIWRYNDDLSQWTSSGFTSSRGIDAARDIVFANITSMDSTFGVFSNGAPTITSIDINSSDPTLNDTDQNISLYVRNASDFDGDSVTNISNWYRNATSLTIFNLAFDTNATTNITDYSGNQFHASTTANPRWIPNGIYGGAYFFNESNTQRIQIANNASYLSGNRSFSLEAWINQTSTPGVGAFDYIVCKEPSSGTSGWCLRVANPANLTFLLVVGGTSRTVSQTIGGTSNKTHHVIATWNESNMTLWFDGLVVDSRNIKGNVNTNTQNVTIGNWNGNSRAFNGTIDTVRMYNRSLTPEEILYLNNSGSLWETIVSQETESGENWTACVTPNDATTDGTRVCSANFTVIPPNREPTITSIDINSSDPTSNKTDVNLTIYIRNVSDIDGDNVKNITNWFVSNVSWTLLHVPFEGGSNATFTRDYSGENNSGVSNGTVAGATFSATGGIDGKGAYTFDGTNDNITLASTQTLNVTGEAITMMAWVNVSANPTTARQIIGRANGTGTRDRQYAIYITGATNTFGCNIVTNNSNVDVSSAPGTVAGTWVHVACTYNGSLITRYINGTSIGTAALKGTIVDRNSSTVIGMFPTGTSFFNGTIDEVMIFNRSLSAEQIRALYQNRTDLIVAQETTPGENWSACVTPNDGTTDGSTVCSSNLRILADDTAPSNINLTNPTNALSNISNNHVFGSTATDDFNLVNATLYHNISGSWVANQTVTRNGTSNTSNFNVSNIPFGTYLWNVQWCDNSSQCAQADSNFTFTVSPCGTVDSSFTLLRNVTVNGGCFNITADNVVLDCAGYTISGNGSGIGINASLRDNITIRNCNIQDFNNNIRIVRTNNSFLINNTIGNSTDDTVSLITGSNHNQILNNTINNSLRSVLSAPSLSVNGVNNTIAYNIIINNRSVGLDISGNGNVTIANNTIISNASEALSITPADNLNSHYIFNNTIYTNESSAIFISGNDYVPVHNITIAQNRISGSGRTSIVVYITVSSGNTLIGNNITMNGNAASGTTAEGILIDAYNTTVTNNTVTDSGDGWVYYHSFGENNTISYNTFSTGNGTAVFVDGGSSSILNSFLNNTLISNNLTLRFRNSQRNNFTNTILRTNNTWITTETSGTNNIINNTIFDNPNGSIRFPSPITLAQRTTVELGNLNISHNRTFLNSTNLSAFNVSGIITLRSITFTDPRPTIDTEDDGVYRNCDAPECNELSFSGNIFIYNTTHFTSHSSGESGGGDTTNPSGINLTNPPNATINISHSHVFFSNASDNVELVNATLYHNISGSWVANQTVTRNGTFNTSSFNIANILDGGYTWNVRWCDNSSNCAFASSNNTFIINNLPREINLINPPNNTYNRTTTQNFTSNATDDRQLANATLFHNINGTFAGNQSATRNGTFNTSGFTVANIADGIYIWNVKWCDTDGNCSFSTNSTGNFTFTIDTTRPSSINLVSPANGTSNSSTTWQFGSNATDALGLVNATLYQNINGTWSPNQTNTVTGTTATTSFNISNVATGSYIWNVQWCDESGNCNQSNSNFTFTVESGTTTPAPSGGGNTAGSSGRTQTIIVPEPKAITPAAIVDIPESRINITLPERRIREALAKTISFQLPIRIRTIDWFLLLVLAILLAIWIIKKEWQYLREYRTEIEKVHAQTHAHKVKSHIFRDIVNTLTKSVRILAVSVEDIFHAVKVAILATRSHKIKLAKLASLTKARYVRSLEKAKKLLIAKQLKEERLLELEKVRRERLARLESLRKHRLEIKTRIASIRSKLLQSVSLTEKQLLDIESTFKKPLPYTPELMPHPEVKTISEYENDSREFNYLYNKIDEHIKENNLTTAKEAYNALVIIFRKLVQETENKYELISAIKEVETRLSLAILSAQAREKVEEYIPQKRKIEIEKLPESKKYRKYDGITEEELNIDYLKALLKKNNYKKAIELYNELYEGRRKAISTPKAIKPIEIKGLEPIKSLKQENLPTEKELQFDYLRQLLKGNEYKKAIELYKSINPNFARQAIKSPSKIKSIKLEKIKPHHHKGENIKQSEDLRLSYLRELLNKNEYKEAIRLYENIYQRKKEVIKRPKKVEPVFIGNIEPIKYEKLGSLPSESELNVDSLRRLLKKNDYKTARKIFNKVFKE